MRTWTIGLTVLLMGVSGWAGVADKAAAATPFIRQWVESLLDDKDTVPFPMAEKLFAIDNGEEVTREAMKEVWPAYRKKAFKKKITADDFLRDVKVQVYSPKENKKLMANKRVLAVYQPQDGDLFCDLSQVKEGVENFIGEPKAFQFIIRKMNDKWTLIAVGG
jgi:hypothetical protein